METIQYPSLYVFLHQTQGGVKKRLTHLFKTVTCHTVFILDVLSGRFDYISKKLAKQLAYPAKMLESEGLFFFSSIISVEDYRRLVSNYLLLLKQVDEGIFTCVKRYKEQFKILKADGNYLTVQVFMVLYKESSADARPYFIGIIKEEKEAHGNSLYESLEDEKVFLTLQAIVGQLKCLLGNSASNARRKKLHVVTHREIEILNLLSRGFSTKILASHLHISTHTVESHRKNLLTKFQVKNTPELIKAAHKYID